MQLIKIKSVYIERRINISKLQKKNAFAIETDANVNWTWWRHLLSRNQHILIGSDRTSCKNLLQRQIHPRGLETWLLKLDSTCSSRVGILEVINSYSNGKCRHFVNNRHTENEAQITSVELWFWKDLTPSHFSWISTSVKKNTCCSKEGNISTPFNKPFVFDVRTNGVNGFPVGH